MAHALQMEPASTFADPIPTAYISIPDASGIGRPRLIERIEHGVRQKLTVVSAPGGWGKTTLLAAWARSTRLPVAWVTLDQTANDPTAFFRLIVAALDRAIPTPAQSLSFVTRIQEQAQASQFDRVLLDRLDEREGNLAIVLDDLHLITNPDLHAALHRMVEQLPPHVHLVIATRGDVPFPVARMRVSGNLTMLRAPDLAFSVNETRDMLAVRLGGAPPSQDDLDLLVQRTEGWIAGLRLAELSLAESTDYRATIERLGGTHQDIADYFCEEVIARLDMPLRTFLLESSVPETFSADLCNEMMGITDARQRIERVAAANLFLVPLDHDRQWYRYHALFRDMLLDDLLQQNPERARLLHERASQWFERAFMIRQAVSHAEAIGDFPRVADLVDSYAHILMYACGETSLLVHWIDLLDMEELRRRPRLLWAYTWALTTIGRMSQAQAMLDRFDSADGDQDGIDRSREAMMLAVRSRLAAYQGDQRAALVLGEKALERLDTEVNARTHGDIVLSMGFAHRALGHIEEAAEHFALAAQLGRQHGNVQAARWGVRYLALTRMSQGRLNEAEAIVDEDLDRVRHDSADPGSTLSALLVAKSDILLARNRLPEAIAALKQAIPMIQATGDAKMLSNAYATMGKTLLALGQHIHAREKIRRSEDVFALTKSGASIALFDLLLGNTDAAARWANSSGFAVTDDPDPSRGEAEQEIYARIMLATNPSDASFGLIDRLIDDAETDGRPGKALDLHLDRAVSAARLDRMNEAHTSVTRALSIASPDGFVRPFLNQGEPMRRLLRDVVRDRTGLTLQQRSFALSLLSQFGGESTTTHTATLAEPLTERQMEILRLLAAGRSNRDIATELFIAEGTVKAHMHQLFGKLAARSRTEAVANARSLNLFG